MISSIYKNRKVNPAKLVPYGFEQKGQNFVYYKTLSESGFVMTVTVTSQGDVSAVVNDPAFEEPYILHLVSGAVGSFVGGIKAEYEQLLTDIAEKCFDLEVFKTEYAKQIITYVRETFGDELEFLWKKSDSAIWRRKDNEKWYGVLLKVSKRKLGIESDEMAEIIDLRVKTDELEKLIGSKKYYPGYHMNKKHWCTIILDGSVPYDEICQRIQDSYLLGKK